jgi:hypothetical protein
MKRPDVMAQVDGNGLERPPLGPSEKSEIVEVQENLPTLVIQIPQDPSLTISKLSKTPN